jgi:hypothetical protein
MMMSSMSSMPAGSRHRSADRLVRRARLGAFALVLAGLLVAACGSRAPSEAAAPAGASTPAPAAAGAPPAASTAAATSDFSPARDWPVPPQWRSETIAFPLEFAPQLAHRGVEELRFAPGMFQSGAPDYWSYAFVWWVEDRPLQEAAALAQELTLYFRGLLSVVAKERATSARPGRPIPASVDPAAISCTLRSDGERDGWRRSLGDAVVQDAFGDGRKVTLHVVVAQRDFAAAGRRAILVLASPAELGQGTWQQLEAVAASFAPAP